MTIVLPETVTGKSPKLLLRLNWLPSDPLPARTMRAVCVAGLTETRKSAAVMLEHWLLQLANGILSEVLASRYTMFAEFEVAWIIEVGSVVAWFVTCVTVGVTALEIIGVDVTDEMRESPAR